MTAKKTLLLLLLLLLPLLLLAIIITIITSHAAKIWTYTTCGLLPAKILQCYKPTTSVCASRVHMACTTRSVVPSRPADVSSTVYCVGEAKDSYRESISATQSVAQNSWDWDWVTRARETSETHRLCVTTSGLLIFSGARETSETHRLCVTTSGLLIFGGARETSETHRLCVTTSGLIIIIRAFIRRTISASELNLRRQYHLLIFGGARETSETHSRCQQLNMMW